MSECCIQPQKPPFYNYPITKWLPMLFFRNISLPMLAPLLFGLAMADATAAKDLSSRPEYRMRSSLFEELREHRDIVMLGDSLTARGEWGEFYPGASIANRGIGGDTTTGILSRLDPIIAMRPKVVFILAGINDLGFHRDPVDIITSYQKIIKILTDSGAKVVVQSTLYVSKNSRLSNNTSITKINKEMKAYCLTENRCEFLDLNNLMSPRGQLSREYTGDGIHLNGKGYLAWLDAIAATMGEYLPPKIKH